MACNYVLFLSVVNTSKINYMNKKMIAILFVATGFFSYSQNTSSTHLSKEIALYAKTNGSYIASIPLEKKSDISFDGEITQEKANLIDPAKMGISVTNRNLIYKITGTDKMLVVKSVYVLENEFKNTNK